MKIEFSLNDRPVAVDADPGITLLDLLREHLHLTGTKKSCGIGECGACTVIVDGEPVNSCLFLAGQAEGKSIYTVEGLAQDGELSRLQKSFLENHAVQCGFCTPGMLMSAKALLLRNPTPRTRKSAGRCPGICAGVRGMIHHSGCPGGGGIR